MCNACGFQCCAFDDFEGCGCYHCDNPLCWPRCPECGNYEEFCDCSEDESWIDVYDDGEQEGTK